MAKRVITREEVIESFQPLHTLLTSTIAHAREHTTLARFEKLHPEITREAARQRLCGQARWILIADGLARDLGAIEGFEVLSSEAQHNSGQYVFAFPGGIFTVRREPHDREDPEDGKYIQEALVELLAEAELAKGVQADEPIVVYLSVSASTAVLKVQHATLLEPMKIAVSDLAPAPVQIPAPVERQRGRARSSRKDDRTAADTADGSAPQP